MTANIYLGKDISRRYLSKCLYKTFNHRVSLFKRPYTIAPQYGNFYLSIFKRRLLLRILDDNLKNDTIKLFQDFISTSFSHKIIGIECSDFEYFVKDINDVTIINLNR